MDHRLSLPPSFDLDGALRHLRLDPRDPVFYSNPYAAYAELHRRAPIVFWEEFERWAVAGHRDVSSLLRDRRFGRVLGDADGRPDYSAEPEHLHAFYAIESNSLLELEPPTHTRLRALVNRAFVSRQIERLEPRIHALADELIDSFAGRGEVELVRAFATPLPVIVIAELLGIDREEAPRLLDWSHRMVAMYQFGRNRQVEETADRAAAEFRSFLVGIIESKREKLQDDLISGLIRAETETGRLSRDEMVSTLILLLNAGHEATVHTIGNAVKALIEEHPFPGRLFSGSTAAAAATEECLRYDTPLHMFTRVALEDVELAPGVRLKRGEKVALLLGAANRDPTVFECPDRFDPHREGPAHVSFGGGIHFCIGAPLARLELRIALSALFSRLPDLRLASERRYRDSYHFRGLERLDLRFSPVRS